MTDRAPHASGKTQADAPQPRRRLRRVVIVVGVVVALIAVVAIVLVATGDDSTSVSLTVRVPDECMTYADVTVFDPEDPDGRPLAAEMVEADGCEDALTVQLDFPSRDHEVEIRARPAGGGWAGGETQQAFTPEELGEGQITLEVSEEPLTGPGLGERPGDPCIGIPPPGLACVPDRPGS